MTVSTLRWPSLSLSQPENSFEIDAVASPMPSMKPTISVLAPSTVVRNTGSRPWIISDEISMNRLTKPSAQMLPGNRVSDDFGWLEADCSLMIFQPYAMIGKT